MTKSNTPSKKNHGDDKRGRQKVRFRAKQKRTERLRKKIITNKTLETYKSLEINDNRMIINENSLKIVDNRKHSAVAMSNTAVSMTELSAASSSAKRLKMSAAPADEVTMIVNKNSDIINSKTNPKSIK